VTRSCRRGSDGRPQGKSAIVPDAGKGIGKAIVRRFLQEGAEVLVCDVERERLGGAQEELANFGTVHARPSRERDRQGRGGRPDRPGRSGLRVDPLRVQTIRLTGA
jgi:NAD(P)-dependent dehydrogenase (short-subunit alcohol dehydrogenase family)